MSRHHNCTIFKQPKSAPRCYFVILPLVFVVVASSADTIDLGVTIYNFYIIVFSGVVSS